MPNKKKKYNARFPPARIKKIMQTDEEVGKVAAAVPVIISRALELFVEALILKTSEITKGRNAKTLTSSHLKQCIQVVSQFDFLKDLVANVPDVQGEEDSNSTSSDSKPLRIKKHGKKERKKREAGTSKEDEDSITESSDIEDVSEDYDDDDEVEAPHPNPTPTSNNSNAVNQMQTNSFSHPNFYNSNNNIDEDDYDA